MTNIFIANLDWEVTSEDLQATFSAFGEVHLAHVVFDAKTKKSKGFGYVEMVSAEEAINAIQALNGFEVNGRMLDVKIASPKANRPPKKDPNEQPKKPFGNKPGGFGGGPKRFNNSGPRPGGGGGGFRSNNSGSSSGGFRSSDNRGPSSGSDRPDYRSSGSSSGSGSGGYRSSDSRGPSSDRPDYRSSGSSSSSSGSSSTGSNDRPPRPRKRFDD